jgi:hypothetical protein
MINLSFIQEDLGRIQEYISFQKLPYPKVKAGKYSYYKFIITEFINSHIKGLRQKSGMSYNI